MRSVPIDTYLSFGNGKKRPDEQTRGIYSVFGSNGPIGNADVYNSPDGTIILGRVGSYCGSVYFSKDKCWVTDNAIKAQAKDNADPRYCYYLLLTKDIHALRGGSGQPLINQASLRSLEVPERGVGEQKAIAHILGTLDDKIELNQKMNQTLEDIAKAIFKSWFVDFDPVRAKVEGRPTGLSAGNSDLFPDAFEDSEIGEIPAGWEIRSGSEVYSHQKGLSYKGEFLSESPADIPMLNLGSFAANGVYREEKLKFYRGDFKDRHRIYEGELLLANTDLTQDRIIIGSPILVTDAPTGHKFYLHTHHTTKILPREESGISSTFLYFTFLQSNFREWVAGFATGTTVLALPKDTFDALQLIIPSKSARTKFEEIVGHLEEPVDFGGVTADWSANA